MNYEQFIFALSECVKEMLPEAMLVEKQEILKNNGVVAIGLSIRKSGALAAPIIYLEDYYTKYRWGETVENLAIHLIDRSKCAPPATMWEYENILDFTKIKDQVVYKLVNAKRNEKLLKEVPNLPMLDFAIIFYVLIPVNETENCSILIRNAHMNYWKLPISLLYQCAKDNTKKLCPYILRPLTDYVEDYVDGFMPESSLIILSNELGINGASALLYPEMPKKIFEYVGRNYYLLPSSIHEFLIVPDDRNIFPENLKEIVKDVNENHIAEEELLSDSIYYFDGNIITKM